MSTTAQTSSDYWERAIILVDMNAFFASIEQKDNPEWQGKPVGVTNGKQGSCIITCSYEARALGIKTGMRLKEAKRICPDFIQAPARPERYAEVSTRIMHALNDVTPDVEVYSVDEAFLDVTRCQRLFGNPAKIARQVKQVVAEVTNGLLCSVGVSGDKTTAKYAAKLNKPDGLTVIPPWEAKSALHDVPVTALCGISKGVGTYLAKRGVYTCGDMAKLPIGELASRYGNPGRRIWYMAQGRDPEKVTLDVPEPKSLSHGKIMPPDTRNRNVIKTYVQHMAEKVAARLRKHGLEAQVFYIAFRTKTGWLGGKCQTDTYTVDGTTIFELGMDIVKQNWKGEGFFQLQITALDPRPTQIQGDLFLQADQTRERLFTAMDNINYRYGEFTVSSARLLSRSEMPNVIAPAWKPYGHRQTIIND